MSPLMCDWCGTPAPEAPPTVGQLSQAFELGWAYRWNDILCPTCLVAYDNATKAAREQRKVGQDSMETDRQRRERESAHENTCLTVWWEAYKITLAGQEAAYRVSHEGLACNTVAGLAEQDYRVRHFTMLVAIRAIWGGYDRSTR